MKIRKRDTINVKGISVKILQNYDRDYICLSDIAKTKEGRLPDQVIHNWMRTRHTVDFLGVWEKINNSSFNPLEFEGFKEKAGLNSFILTPSRWIEKTNAIGFVVKKGRYGGVYAHKHIALSFASWISSEFHLYLVTEFDRLKEKELEDRDWNTKRVLTKINYKIHTDAIKNHLIPKNISKNDERLIYATEADILNLALFSMTAKEFREKNQDVEGNIRDYANVSQLVCLSNLESLNSIFIKNGLSKEDRLEKLNTVAIEQMTILVENAKEEILKLEGD